MYGRRLQLRQYTGTAKQSPEGSCPCNSILHSTFSDIKTVAAIAASPYQQIRRAFSHHPRRQKPLLPLRSGQLFSRSYVLGRHSHDISSPASRLLAAYNNNDKYFPAPSLSVPNRSPPDRHTLLTIRSRVPHRLSRFGPSFTVQPALLRFVNVLLDGVPLGGPCFVLHGVRGRQKLRGGIMTAGYFIAHVAIGPHMAL